MTIQETIRGRRSIRKYTTDPVPDEVLSEIMEAGLYAPSAVNYQPWYFVAIRSPNKLEELKHIMQVAADRTRPSLEKRFAAHPEVIRESLQFIAGLGNAPVCVLAFQEKPQDQYVKNQSNIHQSVAAAIQNMLLTAWEKGIGSCWMTAPVNEGLGDEIRNSFAPDKGELVAVFTLGYPAQTPQMPKRKENRFRIE
ncbi:MAG: nitroreductase family protein [Lachnospiraceae bacterium]|nr:nitroreductase family protein [Lachnospiraceae bacterium]